MLRYIICVITTIICFTYLNAQSVPTSYKAAQKIGEAKLAILQITNAPAASHYVVLKKGCNLGKLLKQDNTVYVIDKDYNLNGKHIFGRITLLFIQTLFLMADILLLSMEVLLC